MKTYKQQLRSALHGILKTRDLDDDFYEEISHDWQERARKLQERRWHKLEIAEKTIHYHA